MVQRLVILSGLIITTSCSILPLIPVQIQLVPIQHQSQPQEVHIPNYSFSYNVNDGHTGDIKHQQETRHGGTVTGQYSLIQPDGIRRTVDYRADDARGFQATVNNGRDNLNRQADVSRQSDEVPQWQIQPQNVRNVTPSSAPVAISRSSIVQHIQSQSRQVAEQPWQ